MTSWCRAAIAVLAAVCGLAAAEDYPGCRAAGHDYYQGLRLDSAYPAPVAELQSYVDHGRADDLRSHSWLVFSRLLEPAPDKPGFPRWETWYSFEEMVDGGARAAFPPSAAVLYNRELCGEIRRRKLFCKSTLDNLLPTAGQPGPEITIDSREAAAVKTSWQQISFGGDPADHSVEVWDFHGSLSGRNLGSGVRRVCVYRPGPSGAGTDCPGEKAPVPLNRFYGEPVGGKFRILLGFHFTTRELDNWVWGTFWWHDRPNDGPYASGRPPSLPPPWNNYLMDTAYDMDNPPEHDGGPKIVYNFYLEGGQTGGTRSNCVTCHRRALWGPNTWAWRLTLDSPSPVPPEVIMVRGSIAATRTYLPEYDQSVKLPFLWTLKLKGGRTGTARCP